MLDMMLEKSNQVATHPVLNNLWQIIKEKKSNIALSADLTLSDELIAMVEAVKDQICVLKTHIDIVSDFTPSLTKKLRKLADDHQFLIFEDRKFADIGNTVKHQVKDSIFKIAEWADIINAHTLPGDGIIHGLKEGCQGRDIGLLLLAQMSSQNNLFSQDYIKKTIQLAKDNRDFVIGFIAQEKLTDDDLIVMTPGVQLRPANDHLGQNYNTPEKIIIENQLDVAIIGRGIYQAEDPKKQAQIYQEKAWQALLKRRADLI